MKTPDLPKIRKAMEKELSPKRYEHTLSVAYTAASLAMVHGEDTESAILAGMLHDCAKCLPGHKLIDICEKNKIHISEAEKENPMALLHAGVGSFLAHDKYGIDNENILNAIRYHTTGRPNMSRLEKIIYIADYIEPGRKHAANLPQIRRMAFQDLDMTMIKILEDTLAYLSSADGKVDTMTAEAYNYYKKQQNKTQ
ncbi:MAG: bis(5'-nucleosyl)-tetraphosphatase (symmetrical) YqeK [Clostridiales bacterium]|nr:bis(5'-nucleosyl)-tetraphosphatase (symmetrical) YqeK [Clostridiales bacterium]